jgi:hypothetical protein
MEETELDVSIWKMHCKNLSRGDLGRTTSWTEKAEIGKAFEVKNRNQFVQKRNNRFEAFDD